MFDEKVVAQPFQTRQEAIWNLINIRVCGSHEATGKINASYSFAFTIRGNHDDETHYARRAQGRRLSRAIGQRRNARQSHPQAQDTIDGIADWWLTERRVRQGIAEVEVALRHLVERGLVDVDVRKDGKKHYSLNLRKQK